MTKPKTGMTSKFQRLEAKMDMQAAGLHGHLDEMEQRLQRGLHALGRMVGELLEGANEGPWLMLLVPDSAEEKWWKPSQIFLRPMRLYFLCAHDYAPVSPDHYYKVAKPREWVKKHAALVKYSLMGL